MRFVKCVGSLVVMVVCLFNSSAMAGLEVLVASGDAAPDDNGVFSVFGNPSLNNAGQVAFAGLLTGTAAGQADSVGVFRGDVTSVTRIARAGESYLGAPILGFTPTSFYIDATGAIVGTVVTGPPNTFTLFRGDGGPLENLIPNDLPSPSGNNILLGAFSRVVNENGVLVYSALYGGVNQERGLYERTLEGTVTTRLLVGDAAPRGGVFDSSGGKYTLNESKQIATVAAVSNNDDTVNSLLRINPASIDELVRAGDLLADGITSIQDFSYRAPVINNSGAIAFSAEYEQPGLLPEGVFIADSSGVTLVAGRLLPGGSAGVSEIDIFGFNDNQQIAFSAEVGFGIDPPSAIYIADSAGVSLIALEETMAPGTGKLFAEFPISAATSNAIGDLAFLADLTDVVGGSADGRALFRYTESEGLAPIVQTGDPLNGSTISEIFYAGTTVNSGSNHPDESINGMNDSGQITFTFSLADGQSGIALWSPDDNQGDFDDDGDIDGSDFLTWQRGDSPTSLSASDLSLWESSYGNSTQLAASQAAVPEPASLVLLGVCLAGLLSCRFCGC